MDDNIIKEIAEKHHVGTIDPDDPIWITHTLMNRLKDENIAAQREIVAEMRQQMEVLVSQWFANARDAAQGIFDGAKMASEAMLDKSAKRSVESAGKTLRKEVDAAAGMFCERIRENAQGSKSLITIWLALVVLAGAMGLGFTLCWLVLAHSAPLSPWAVWGGIASAGAAPGFFVIWYTARKDELAKNDHWLALILALCGLMVPSIVLLLLAR